MTRFEGFPERTFTFYEDLTANNTKVWWNAHKAEYEDAVKRPMQALTEELSGEFGAAKLFRPYNDQRFHQAEPIKTHQGAAVALEDAVAYYVQVGADGLFVAGGWYAPQGKQLGRYREAVAGPAGAELARLMRSLGRRFVVQTDSLATRPRGVDPDHPHLEQLRYRKVTVGVTYPVAPWLSTRKPLAVVRKDWRTMRPLFEWLADHVGPFGEPADEA